MSKISPILTKNSLNIGARLCLKDQPQQHRSEWPSQLNLIVTRQHTLRVVLRTHPRSGPRSFSRYVFTAAALLALAACTSTKPAATADSPPTQMAKQFKLEKKLALEANYLLFLPKDYDTDPGKRWPLMMFLHGSGERGTDVWKVAKHGPPKEVTAHPDFPFIVVSPQCPEGRIWSDDVVLALLDEIIRLYRVDTGRVYLTGLSMGGYATWSLGVTHPEKFAAIVPICGGGNFITLLLSGPEQAEALKSMGVWAFHGAKDPVVPLAESQRMVEAMKHLGVKDVKLTVYPEALHDCWTETYKNPELYDWLLKHERKAAKE